MKNRIPQDASRRGFLWGAASAAMLAPVAATVRVDAQQPLNNGAEIALVTNIKLNREVYQHDANLAGSLSFRKLPKASVEVQWIDGFGRTAGRTVLPTPASLATPLPFSFDLRNGLTYVNTIRVLVGGVPQAVAVRFLRSPAPFAWNDYHVISWANYPDGYYDQLRDAGVNATIAYREGDFSNVLDNNFDFYVEQMAWEVYAIYHKNLPYWRETLAKVRADRANLEHWVRKPCLNDPATQEYVRERLQRYVRQHSAFRPLYYTIADELGQGDQISANDFCHSTHCAIAFSEYLRKKYDTLQHVQAEWRLSEMIRWDDEGIRSGNDWEHNELLISRTTTDLAFEAVALANLQNRYGSVTKFNKEFGTSFPEPNGGGMGASEIWEPVLGAVRETLSIVDMNEAGFEKALGSVEHFNTRCGNRAGWNAPQKPTSFKSWTEVKNFLLRYDKELGEVTSTKGWNVAAWSDFRNFMDETFADAVERAAKVCKAEDPSARCATEGGQAPFAFGWYNYEQVVRVVDVIEPYNIGNNVEIVRSLKPETIMLSTVGFDHKPGVPLTDADRLRQRQAVRPVWWELFHSHQGTIIWDNQEAGGTFVDLKTGETTASADTFRDVFKELRSGIGMQIINAARTHDGIAIHYSHPSIQAHWLLENAAKSREWMMNTVEAYVTSRFVAVRNSWTKLIEDLQVQYDFLSATQVGTGELNSGKFKIFFMPESIAVSPAEAAQIRDFVRSGGIVVADFRAAQLNDHCRDLGAGQLNDLFGIVEGEPQTTGPLTPGAARPFPFDPKTLSKVTPADTTIRATTGEPLLRAGSVPMLIVNRYGDGQAIYLNMDLADYGFNRLDPKASDALPNLIDSILTLAQIRPRVHVTGADGKRLPGTEVVIFRNGAVEQIAIFRNPQLDDGGWGSYRTKNAFWRDWTASADNSVLEKQATVNIQWNSSKPTYDVRAKKSLGSVNTVKATLDPWEPLVFTQSARPLPELALAASSSVKPGAVFKFTLNSAEPHPQGTQRVVQVDLVKPSGEVYSLYAQNLLVAALPHTAQIPIAFNDPAGQWTVRAHDLLTGQALEAVFTVA